MKKQIIILLCALCLCQQEAPAQVNDASRNIGTIKRDTTYLYAEATMKDLDEALSGAKAILEVKIGDWVRTAYPQEGVEVCIAKAKEHCFQVQTRRGDYHRAFVYVKKSDIMPVSDKSEVIVFQVDTLTHHNSLSVSDGEVLSEESSQEISESDYSLEEQNMLDIRNFYQIEPYIKTLKAQGRLYDYGKYASMPTNALCYVFVYDRQGDVVAVLRKTFHEQFNLRTQQKDQVKNYKNCGAIWFQLK